MGTVVGIVAAVVALIGLLAALGHVGYLAMLNSAAKQRGAAGEPIADYVKSRWMVAGGSTAVAALGLLLTASSGVGTDILGMLLGAGGGLVGYQALNSTRARYRSQP
ncbi:hypothetical protein [Pseudonocardia acidicola]|uniref:Uncharacterized protein n=1 Tax=Pseudonocardia acidicola TaxID=2724939 RepID=A0ABX1SE55_9PSEU|nr:hypothetical protein [Pseudonocardia acidicola]NMH99097.1 hypothetical protein [Pseudonocardia acidicola]